jgi:hypothetical protein
MKKSGDDIIWLDTPKLNCWTCGWMYKRKASLKNLPINMMVNTGIPDKYIAIAAVDLMEWVPILLALYARTSLSTKQTTAQRQSSNIFEVTCLNVPLKSL